MKNNSAIVNNFYNKYKRILKIIEEEICLTGNLEDSEQIKRFSRILLNKLIFIYFLETKKDLIPHEFKLEELFKKCLSIKKDFYPLFKNLCEMTMLEEVSVGKLYKKLESSLMFKYEIEKKSVGSILISNKTFSLLISNLKSFEWSLDETSQKNTMTPELLGYIFEKFVNQKETGAYYTSKETTNYIVENTIGLKIISELTDMGLVEKKVIEIDSVFSYGKFKKILLEKNQLEYVLKRILGYKNIKSLRILDPTCGSGAFLFATLNFLTDIIKTSLNIISLNEDFVKNRYLKKIYNQFGDNDYEILSHIIKNNIFGVDIEEEAVDFLKINLYLKLISKNKNFDMLEDIDKISKNFYHGNSLYGDVFEKNINKYNKEYIPFNWNSVFKNILLEGGFDCIVGNPPYVEYPTSKRTYPLTDISLNSCTNLYAHILERSFQLLKENGICGKIIPISFVSTKRMNPLREKLINNSEYLFVSNYADRPGCLFKGVHQKLSIIFFKKKLKSEPNLYTSKYFHWYTNEFEEDFFNKIKYYKNEFLNFNGLGFIKIGNNIENSIIKKIFKKKRHILENAFEGSHYIYLCQRLSFWNKCFLEKKESKEYKKINFISEKEKNVVMAVFNSSLFWFYWECVSDAWHLTSKELLNFKLDYDDMDDKIKNDLFHLAIKLEKDLEIKKVEVNTSQTSHEYKHKFSKDIIDCIDDVLSNHYNLTLKETNYIKNYNIKYR